MILPRRSCEPTVEQLSDAPELGSLAILDAAISTTILALGAVYPEMQVQDPDDQTASLRAATLVIEDAQMLAGSLARYRYVLARLSHRLHDDTPF